MQFSKNKIDLLSRTPLIFVDAGARGDLEGDWRNFVPGTLHVIAFEPDPTAVVDWENESTDNHLMRCALWSHETTVDIHIGQTASTSSVWPPNREYLQNFANRHVDPRVTEKVVQVPARPLDDIARELSISPDFLKIDTQGAELQILQGSAGVLSGSAFGAIVETWTAPVHKGQGLSHDVMALMYNAGFGLFQCEVAAAWDRRIVEKFPVSHRRQIIGFDFLFFKEPSTIIPRLLEPGYAAKFAITAEMYGHYDLAVEVLTTAIDAGATESAELAALRQEICDAYAVLNNSQAKTHEQHPTFLQRLVSTFRKKRSAERVNSQKLHY